VLLTSEEADVLSQEAVDEMLPVLKESLKTFALSAGWPVNLVEELDISYDGGILYISCSDEDAFEAIQNLEYGDGGNPNAVLRPFAERSDKYIADVIGLKAVMYTLENQVGL
jgi:hypothetical protein